jgi:hypothetical protein
VFAERQAFMSYNNNNSWPTPVIRRFQLGILVGLDGSRPAPVTVL